MKKILLLVFTALSINTIAQTNTFPTIGNVGIGTTLPQQTLTVDTKQSASNAGVPALNGDVQNGILRLQVNGNSWGETLDFGMNVLPTYAWIQATNRGNLGVNYNLALNPNGGNVGIGTSTPLSNLEVANSLGAVLSISTNKINGSMASPLRPTIDFLGYANGNKARISATEQTYDTHGSKLSMFVNDGSSATSLVERLTIDMNGNVGIGTISPQHKLDINGNTQFNGMFGYELSDIFTYKNTTIPHYGFRWNQDDWYSGGRTMLLSSYGGFKLFTAGAPRFFIIANGNVGIKTENPKYELDVLGTIHAKEVLVNLDGGADFVFEKGYKLLTIEHVANYVQENKHLPDIPSANEMLKNGVSMGDLQVKLLQKVEELTLYAIQENNSKKQLERKYNALLERVEMLTKQIERK